MLHPVASPRTQILAGIPTMKLSVEEFSCQSSMECTCGQYCSSQSMGRDLTRGVGGITYGWTLLYCALEYADHPSALFLWDGEGLKTFTAEW